MGELIDWLDARVEMAQDLFCKGHISYQESERALYDAITGQYSGPMRLVDGTITKEDEFVSEHFPECLTIPSRDGS